MMSGAAMLAGGIGVSVERMNANAAGEDLPDGEEVLVLTAKEKGSEALLSLESNLLERGLFFRTQAGVSGDEVESGEVLQAGLKVILIDEAVLRILLARPEWKSGLEKFSQRGGYLSVLPVGYEGREGFQRTVSLDTLHASLVEEAIVYAGLTCHHPSARRVRLGRDVGVLMKEELVRVTRWVSSEPVPSEFFLHYGRGIGALIEAGDTQVGALFGQAASSAIRCLSEEPFNHDSLTVLYAAVMLGRSQVCPKLLQDSYSLLRRTFARRPQFRGMAAGSGFEGAALSAFEDGAPSERIALPGAINGFGARDVVSNEMLHFHAPLLAAYGREFSDEHLKRAALALCDHVYTVHLMSNGLLHHISRDGRAAGWAWGRGQTHALYGLVYAMEEFAPESEEMTRLKGYLKRHLTALLPLQDSETGLWRNLVDCQDARVESSCTVGITYAMCRAIRSGWIEGENFEKAVARAWPGILFMMHKSGLAAMCRGTLAGEARAHYLARPQGWGRVPQILMLALELERMGMISPVGFSKSHPIKDS